MLTVEGRFGYSRPALVKATVKVPFLPEVPGKQVDGMLDTGASVCVISPTVLNQLPLPHAGRYPFHTIGNSVEVDSYTLGVSLEDNQGNRAVVEPVKATCQTLPGNYDLIIGRIILGLGTLTTESQRFTFQIEPGQHIPTHE